MVAIERKRLELLDIAEPVVQMADTYNPKKHKALGTAKAHM